MINEPYARSFAGVPLLTPDGYAIGTISFFDDQPRAHRLSKSEVTFMQDVASTTMAHIEKVRLVVAHARGLRMVHGLSRFIEGKTTADARPDSYYRDAEDMQHRQTVQTSELGASRRTHAMNAASNAERMDDFRRAQPSADSPSPRARSGSSVEEPDYFFSKARQSPGTQELRPHSEDVPPVDDKLRELRTTTDSEESTFVQYETLPGTLLDDLQEDLVAKDVRHSFERAAAIINTAMSKQTKEDMHEHVFKVYTRQLRVLRIRLKRLLIICSFLIGLSGTLFLDASVGEFSRLRDTNASTPGMNSVKSGQNALLSGTDNHSESSGSDSSPRSSSKTKRRVCDARDRAEFHQDHGLKSCRNLASAYAMPSTTSGKAEIIHLPVPERYLKSLLRRFPYGKHWNLDPYGNTSSDEFSDSSGTTETSTKPGANRSSGQYNRQNRYRRQTDGQILSELFPGARSLALMPMYDGVRDRFFAGAFVWSYDPVRVLTAQDDLNYLGAFCDVIMAEVGRLDAQGEAQTKASFISSMSHELRTPLVNI